ncbi:hypothetical protein CGLO_11890 [Colletotrichum gloeosporioides Cg-14]|uniref:Uncharacterized protein n=1 Tax=Colletotrichum gloeosporioides (strain Cg-14) TaxID=1237896 RepID=T0KA10_COLGC|nr:hypothetical protein CGLO_11890 [Colletotrichum gloeosporioides Cg-14]
MGAGIHSVNKISFTLKVVPLLERLSPTLKVVNQITTMV